jgi:hypothetical protein
MKLKTRLLAPLFAVLMLGTATSAYADLVCAITVPTPAARTVVNGHWENTGDMTFTCAPSAGALGAAPTTDASITIYYQGLTITNSPTTPASHPIEIFGSTMPVAVVLDATRPEPGFVGGVNNAGSLVAITIPAQAVPAGGSFTLRNVVLSMAGGAVVGNPISANVNVLSTAGNTVLTGSPVVVVSNVLPMLNSTTAPPELLPVIVGQTAGPAQFTATGGLAQPTPSCPALSPCANNRSAFSVSVSEDHIDSWRTTAQYYNNGVGTTVNGTNVLYTFSGMLPGSIISNCVIVPPAGTTWTLTGSGIAGTAGTTTMVAELIAGPTNLTAIETLLLNCGTSTTNPAYLPGTSSGNASTAITVSMSPFPTGTALPGPGGTPSSTVTPRYATTGGTVGPVTVVQFGASATGQTTMLIPYALSIVGYDTGIAVGNTTKDGVFGTDAQGFAALDTAGTIQFNFYPADGSASFSITTPSVPSGNSYITTLSNLLKTQTSTPQTFQGYILAVANFTHAHGMAFVYGGLPTERLTSATDVLVISNPLAAPRNAYAPLVGVEATSK